jgi:hypothetical protein
VCSEEATWSDGTSPATMRQNTQSVNVSYDLRSARRPRS